LYRHYPSKEDLAWVLFSTAYLRTGAELDALRARHPAFRSRLGAMIAHFCALYDRDPALFRFMLLVQHGMLPRIPATERTPVEAVEECVREAVDAGEIAAVEPSAAAAAIFGIVLQTAVFHAYGRVRGPLSKRAAALTRAAVAAVEAVASGNP
jgi:AcrR family transcriptional regulator